MPLWQNYMHRRERWYHDRDNNRLVRPFEWGLPYVLDHVNGDDPREVLGKHAASVMESSDDFYALPEIADYQLEGDHLTWTSAVHTPSLENNRAHARYFPVQHKNGKKPRNAVVVLPQWNAQPQSHVEACRIFNLIGMAALRLTLPYHLQRKFKEAVGLSPAQYIRARKSERLKSELKRGETVSRASFGAGYGSSSRVYGDAPTRLGMTPATYKSGGHGAHIDYVITKTSLGSLLVGATNRGVCAVTLGDNAEALEAALESEYPAASRTRLTEPWSALRNWVESVVSTVQGAGARPDIPLDVQASAFQWKVWNELQKIPFGETRSYSDIANAIGAPKAVRAVASAIANNRVAVVIPCHRVVRQSGELGGYKWGLERKRKLLAKERNTTRGGTS